MRIGTVTPTIQCMRPNTIRSIWQAGGAVINGWCGIPSGWSAEIMAHAGYDSVTLDLQHGVIHYDTAVPMLQAISTTAAIPLARVPRNEAGIIMKLLDAGAYGVICPMVNTREECERFVGAARYPASGGYRSYGPVRASVYGGADYFDQADRHVLTFAMIETAQAVQNLDAILSVPGLDAVYVGPADLSISITGRPRMEYHDAPELFEVLDLIVAGCRKYGLGAGIHCSGASHAKAMIARGFNFVTLLSDGAYLAAAVQSDVRAMRDDAAEGDRTGPY
jgi:4-hydroxy-2-oxoheptanedioate aldolase